MVVGMETHMVLTHSASVIQAMSSVASFHAHLLTSTLFIIYFPSLYVYLLVSQFSTPLYCICRHLTKLPI